MKPVRVHLGVPSIRTLCYRHAGSLQCARHGRLHARTTAIAGDRAWGPKPPHTVCSHTPDQRSSPIMLYILIINSYLSPFWVKFSASALPPWQATLPQWRLARIESSTLALGRVSLLLAVGRPWCPHVRRTSLGGVRDTDLERVRSASFVTPTHAAWTLSLAIARRRSVPVPAGSQAPPGRIGN